MEATHFILQWKNSFGTVLQNTYPEPIESLNQLLQDFEGWTIIYPLAIFKIKYKQPCHLPK